MFPLPEYVDFEAWSEYIAMRAKEKLPLTPRVIAGRLKELQDIRDAGYDVTYCIDSATNGKWQKFYAVEPQAIVKKVRVESTVDYAARRATESALDRARISPPTPAFRELVAKMTGA